ncbi:related to apoptosis-inducing TAF9-like domain 1 family protein, putative [Rhynchosporium graminicola]|uniref:Related to apoptosis-inducing TAF9-like domain 1 family protein, putative n=1 Tax=Rhynchosporium graminicola TaxID=2792576 RepID=A0A1E1LSP4_9HELO|nr:related to apoptosis-inducing TAF9-like domain 1 family protein, putative [Rhynchosporium commune]
MSQQSQDGNDTREKLKASLWFSVGKLVDEEAASLNTTATPQFIGSMSEMVWAQLETVAIDLESFSRHANRTTITTDDVLLMTRKNDALLGMMKDFVDAEKAKTSAASTRKGVNKGKGRPKK